MHPVDSARDSLSQQLRSSLYWGLLVGGAIGFGRAMYDAWHTNHFVQKGLTNVVLEILARNLVESVLAVFSLIAVVLLTPTLLGRLFASLSNARILRLSLSAATLAWAGAGYYLNNTRWFPPFSSVGGILGNTLLSLLALVLALRLYRALSSRRPDLRLPFASLPSRLYSPALLKLSLAAFVGFHLFAYWKLARRDPPGPNLVILSIDTLRADHLGCYGYERDTSPHIDRFAADAVRFNHAYVPRGMTWPSLTSMLTSLHPKTHGVRENQVPLEPQHLTLTEILKDAGYKTGAFLANFYYSPNRGFDIKRGDEVGDLDTAVTRAAIEWLDTIDPKNDRFFLWLHQKSPHIPYAPEKRFLDLFDPDYTGTFDGKGEATDSVFVNKIDLAPRDLFHLIALYDAEIRSADEHVGRLLAKLREIGVEEETLVVFVSDHGEELYDHNYYFYHSCSVYDSVLRVPLLFKLPKVLDPGKVIDNQISSVDIAPSILELLKLPVPRVFQGSSLLPLLFGDRVDDFHPAFAERTPTIFSIRTPEWKYIHNPESLSPDCLRNRGKTTPYRIQKQELYAVRSDPGEKKNLILEHPEAARDLEAELVAWTKLDKGVHKEHKLSKEAEERLRALGYIQ